MEKHGAPCDIRGARGAAPRPVSLWGALGWAELASLQRIRQAAMVGMQRGC
jgi:hypothetical protein